MLVAVVPFEALVVGLTDMKLGGKAMDPHKELVYHNLGFRALVAEEVYKAYAVQVAVDMICDEYEWPFRKVFKAVGVPNPEIYA